MASSVVRVLVALFVLGVRGSAQQLDDVAAEKFSASADRSLGGA